MLLLGKQGSGTGPFKRSFPGCSWSLLVNASYKLDMLWTCLRKLHKGMHGWVGAQVRKSSFPHGHSCKALLPDSAWRYSLVLPNLSMEAFPCEERGSENGGSGGDSFPAGFLKSVSLKHWKGWIQIFSEWTKYHSSSGPCRLVVLWNNL